MLYAGLLLALFGLAGLTILAIACAWSRARLPDPRSGVVRVVAKTVAAGLFAVLVGIVLGSLVRGSTPLSRPLAVAFAVLALACGVQWWRETVRTWHRRGVLPEWFSSFVGRALFLPARWRKDEELARRMATDLVRGLSGRNATALRVGAWRCSGGARIEIGGYVTGLVLRGSRGGGEVRTGDDGLDRVVSASGDAAMARCVLTAKTRPLVADWIGSERASLRDGTLEAWLSSAALADLGAFAALAAALHVAPSPAALLANAEGDPDPRVAAANAGELLARFPLTAEARLLSRRLRASGSPEISLLGSVLIDEHRGEALANPERTAACIARTPLAVQTRIVDLLRREGGPAVPTLLALLEAPVTDRPAILRVLGETAALEDLPRLHPFTTGWIATPEQDAASAAMARIRRRHRSLGNYGQVALAKPDRRGELEAAAAVRGALGFSALQEPPSLPEKASDWLSKIRDRAPAPRGLAEMEEWLEREVGGLLERGTPAHLEIRIYGGKSCNVQVRGFPHALTIRPRTLGLGSRGTPTGHPKVDASLVFFGDEVPILSVLRPAARELFLEEIAAGHASFENGVLLTRIRRTSEGDDERLRTIARLIAALHVAPGPAALLHNAVTDPDPDMASRCGGRLVAHFPWSQETRVHARHMREDGDDEGKLFGALLDPDHRRAVLARVDEVAECIGRRPDDVQSILVATLVREGLAAAPLLLKLLERAHGDPLEVLRAIGEVAAPDALERLHSHASASGLSGVIVARRDAAAAAMARIRHRYRLRGEYGGVSFVEADAAAGALEVQDSAGALSLAAQRKQGAS